MFQFHIPQCSIKYRDVHMSILNGALWDMMLLYLPARKKLSVSFQWIGMESQKRINPVIMDIHNSIMDIHNSITDIHDSIMDIHN